LIEQPVVAELRYDMNRRRNLKTNGCLNLQWIRRHEFVAAIKLLDEFRPGKLEQLSRIAQETLYRACYHGSIMNALVFLCRDLLRPVAREPGGMKRKTTDMRWQREPCKQALSDSG
jgi:hypothetical protein